MKQMAAKAALCGLAAVACWAQTPAPSGGSGGTSHATQLPLSGGIANGGSVTTQQTPQQASVQAGGAYAGSVPGEAIPPGPISLTIADAVKRGLAVNLGPISANDAARAARDQRLQTLSVMLPNIAATASDTVSQIDLAAYGFQFHLPPGLNFSIPSVVGPFNYSSLQGTLSQSIFDLVQRRNLRSAKALEQSSVLSAKDAYDLVVLAVGGTYLQTLSAAARVASQKAQVDNSQAIYNQAVVRKTAGTNARIDVTRSQVELQTEQQQLAALTADYRKQLIALARLIGLPQDREITLADALDNTPTKLPDAAEAIQTALSHRSDLQASQAQVKAAELALSAARAERLPSVSVSGYYGAIGPNPTTQHGVFAMTASVNVPIYQGGRIGADIDQAEVTLHQRQAELADQRGRVEQGIRTSLIDLETALGQVKVSDSNRALAADTLTQARDRFAAGVATTLEVVQAQQQVAGAESTYISSLFSLNLARLSLAREMGDTEAGLLNKGRP
jgi:outer membrane protein TolC